MAAGSRDVPNGLQTGRFAQWDHGSYIHDTRTKWVLPYGVHSQGSLHSIRIVTNTREKEAISLILTGIEMNYVSTVDAHGSESMFQFLQQLQPEWSRFVTIVKQQHKLDEVSYHKLFDILKQYQKEVHELRAERMAKNANHSALKQECGYYQGSGMTNQTGQFWGDQRAVNVVGARETVGGLVVQQSRIQCFNCKEFGHYAKECRKPKRVKDHVSQGKDVVVDEEIDEQELEAHYSYMAKIQEVPNADSGTDAEPLEQNDSFAFVHELKQEMHADLKYVESLEDELDELESDKAEFSNTGLCCLGSKLSATTDLVERRVEFSQTIGLRMGSNWKDIRH
ncbi:retrovirus-related pol polyprotein from transposon TNT 1-94 [Tanacetum coccineum]